MAPRLSCQSEAGFGFEHLLPQPQPRPSTSTDSGYLSLSAATTLARSPSPAPLRPDVPPSPASAERALAEFFGRLQPATGCSEETRERATVLTNSCPVESGSVPRASPQSAAAAPATPPAATAPPKIKRRNSIVRLLHRLSARKRVREEDERWGQE